MNIEKEIINLNIKLQELMYAQVFNDCSSNSEWLKRKDFTLTQGAANYSFIYILYKIIDEIRPKRILEMGLGQTTKLTSQYANSYSEVILNVIEHNQQWIDIFKKNIDITPNITISQKNLTKFNYNGTESDKYESLDDITNDNKYDLIIIDGPIGYNQKYPRTNILDIIPKNLAEKFVIILDDASREGEKNTANLIVDKLKSSNINCRASYQSGTKTQLIITSTNYEYIHWL